MPPAKANGVLAKQLTRRTISDNHKKAISNYFTKKITDEQYEYIKNNLNILSRKQIADHIGISLYLVNRAIKELGLEVNPDKTIKIHAARSRAHVALATKASAARWNDQEFKKMRSKQLSQNSKKLWKDPKYRLKVLAGIKNIYATTDLTKRLSIIGKERFLNDPAVRIALATDHSSKNSKLNDKVAIILESLKINYKREFQVSNYKFDFKIDNILLEVHGDYWHNLPKNIKNDRAKSTTIEKYFPEYKLKVIWEHELKSVRSRQRLLEILSIVEPQEVDISLDELEFNLYNDKDNIRKFLVSYHYIGDTNRSKYAYVLLYHNQLIAVVVFGFLIRQNISTLKALELVRMCRHPQFYNHNMLSYLISKSIKEIRKMNKYHLLISYADQQLHTGSTYKAANWIDLGNCQSDYQYLSAGGTPMHKKTLYNKAKKMGLKESEFASLFGYIKTKTKPKRKFVMPLTNKGKQAISYI